MKIFQNLAEWRQFRRTLPQDHTLGFVPTMGNLHPGHQSLIAQSQAQNKHTIVSIFVNPTQFNREDDFKYYPRTLDDDLECLEKNHVDYCLLPDREALYADDYRYQLHEQQHSLTMEGAHRPGHFTGVLTVVMKLFQLVKPHCAYFGEKDYQQLQLIRGMVDSFFMDINIVACPTIRETSGLAMSSRNRRLSTTERHIADQWAQLFHSEPDLEQLKQQLIQQGAELDYLVDVEQRRYIAVNVGAVRLIDNKIL